MKILGIETSCDETSAAVVECSTNVGPGFEIPAHPPMNVLANIIASQTDIHARFGGVVPEVASRRHVELVMPTVQEALDKAECTLSDIDCVGVINRPGLIGALIVGVAAAKTIAYAAKIPLVAVHHIEAHIYANWLTDAQIQFPLVCLVVSGGHSDIIYMIGHGQYEILARTRDDAAGECFDKCARAMGLGYPGGPEIDKLAKQGNPHTVLFPRAKVGDTLDFSFSGLKTAVIRYVEGYVGKPPLSDLAASFQAAVVDVLVAHTFRAAMSRGVKQVMMAGGVAANSRLQAVMRERGEEFGITVSAPPPVLCTDNAAMAAAAAYFAHESGGASGLDLDSYASEPLGKRCSWTV